MWHSRLQRDGRRSIISVVRVLARGRTVTSAPGPSVDNLIFSRDLQEDATAREALKDVERLCCALVDTGRLKQTGATRLASDISECGPPPPAELKAA
jgi:hypothetical protein